MVDRLDLGLTRPWGSVVYNVKHYVVEHDYTPAAIAQSISLPLLMW